MSPANKGYTPLATVAGRSSTGTFIGKISFDPTSYSNISFIAQYGEWSLDQPTYNTYLRDPAGVPVTSGNLNIEGNRVTLSESNFSHHPQERSRHVCAQVQHRCQSDGFIQS